MTGELIFLATLVVGVVLFIPVLSMLGGARLFVVGASMQVGFPIFWHFFSYPNYDIHNLLASLTLLVCLSVPPLCFAAGLLDSLWKRRERGKKVLPVWLNAIGLGLFVPWLLGLAWLADIPW
ncbi:MAG: hypothetical protein O7H41_20200 [Planctomycetota bacterium]|nr:hypothetical protein [Planctomycetota bacterium]